ncbi:MAG: transposase, partial [Actinomycetota bacterium]|mgnify:CR=1 FL=1
MPEFLGIDIAKQKFDVVLLVGESKRHKIFDNDESGFKALINWLGNQASDLHACMEATGGFGDDLALFLHERSVTVSVVNPLRIKAFGQSEMVRTKTDKVDAGVIARFCRSQTPAPWQPLSPNIRELRALVRRCAALKEMRVQELQRRAQGTASPLVAESLEHSIAALDAEIKLISDAVADLIRQDEYLRKSHDLLISIPGLGLQSVAVLLAEIPDFRAFGHNKQITAFVGLNPQDRQSGSSVRGRTHISKIGNARLRAILYMCALSARRHNPTLKAFADRLKEAGKSPKVVLVAVARKLLVIAYGVMKTEMPYRADHMTAPAS